MRPIRSLCAVALVLTSTAALVRADNAPATTAPTTKPTRGGRQEIPAYFRELKDLTPDQVEKIKTIHKEFVEQRHALELKERSDLESVLNDEQKKELTAIEEADKERAKERREHRATTKPVEEKPKA